MNSYGITDADKQLLRAIYSSRPRTASDLLAIYYAGDPTRKWRLYYQLGKLHKRGFVRTTPLSRYLGAASPNLYRLTAKGARAIGATNVPQSHYRFTQRIFYSYRQIKPTLTALAQQHGWQLGSTQTDAGRLITAALQKRSPDTPAYIFSSSIPAKIIPDLVIASASKTALVWVMHPAAGSDALRMRVKKYEAIFSDIPCICICITEEQSVRYARIIGRQRLQECYLVCSAKRLLPIVEWMETPCPLKRVGMMPVGLCPNCTYKLRGEKQCPICGWSKAV